MEQGATKDRFTWGPGDIVITKKGGKDGALLRRMEAASTPAEAATLVEEANAHLVVSQDLVMSSKIRAELPRLVLLAAA